ncbi:MAG: S24 family peptidase, partial [Candidatus Korarchaeota archaeon]|nr:S24 family peptidase [Candidatus Korarchaeota archaeon]NIW13411.1 transcriptional regulator [Candidatus Thorarchaeota archaeon]
MATWEVPKDFVVGRIQGCLDDLRIIKVRGDSMIPDFYPGDRILVDTSDKAPTDGTFIITDQYGSITVKKLQPMFGSNKVRVISSNPAYPTQEVTLDDL